MRDSLFVGITEDGRERVHAPSSSTDGVDPANRSSGRRIPNSKIISAYVLFSVWTAGDLPRTEGTRKLKRREIRSWVMGTAGPAKAAAIGRCRKCHRSVCSGQESYCCDHDGRAWAEFAGAR